MPTESESDRLALARLRSLGLVTGHRASEAMMSIVRAS